MGGRRTAAPVFIVASLRDHKTHQGPRHFERHPVLLVPPARFELTTCGLGNRRSILLSYGGTPPSYGAGVGGSMTHAVAW